MHIHTAALLGLAHLREQLESKLPTAQDGEQERDDGLHGVVVAVDEGEQAEHQADDAADEQDRGEEEAGHSGHRRLGCERLARHRLAHSHESCNHSVYQASGKLIRPLVHRLVGDAYCFGCGGYRASEQFNGFSFQHESIEPQFTFRCNPSSQARCDHSTMVGLGERLDAAMKDRNVSVSALAKAVGVSYQGIKKAVDGKTKEMDASNLLKIAGYLKISPEWLRTGQGPRDLVTTNYDSVLEASVHDYQVGRTVSESEWAMLEDFKMLPDDEKAALRNTLKAKADHVRKIVNEYLGKRGIPNNPVSDERVAEAFGTPPPPPPTGVSSYQKVTSVPEPPETGRFHRKYKRP